MKISFFKSIKFRIFRTFLLLILVICATMFIVINNIYVLLIAQTEEANLKSQSVIAVSLVNKTYPGDWHVEGDKLYKGTIQISSDSDFPDLFKKETGLNCTLFAGVTRVATSVEVNGKKVIGTKADTKVTEQVIGKGVAYSGRASVAGIESLTYYLPLKDANGTTIGMFFLGIPTSKAFSSIQVFNFYLLLVSIISFLVGTVIIFFLSEYLCRPIGKTLQMIRELRAGHLNQHIEIKSKDEIGQMAEEMNKLAEYMKINVVGAMENILVGNVSFHLESNDQSDEITPVLTNTVRTMKMLSDDMQQLISAARDGDLQQRCDSSRYQGSWKQLVEEVNSLLDNVSRPVNETMKVMDRLSVNDYTIRMSEEYSGIFKDMSRYVNNVRETLLDLESTLTKVSSGDTEKLEHYIEIGKRCENDRMMPSLIKLMQTVRDLICEVKNLTDENIHGNLRARGNAECFEGGFREVVTGFNETLDAISRPVSQVVGLLSALAQNDFTQTIEEEYEGDFKVIKDSTNAVQQRMMHIESIMVKVSRGDISELDELKQIGRRSEKDNLIPSLIKMMEALRQLINETTLIADAAMNGNLEYRGDTSKFDGSFAKVIQDFNLALNNIALPLNEFSGAMEQIAGGNLNVKVSGQYQGDYHKLSQAVNVTSDSLKSIIREIAFVLNGIASGNLNLSPVMMFKGDFADISAAMNTILDSLNSLMREIHMAADMVASGSEQVSQGSRSLADGATEQASSIEQLTASISDIASRTKLNAANAGKANQIAIDTKENAAGGSRLMQSMMQSMTIIDQSSMNISKIIKVIDDIAFQTNILALNAAIEAARAGQYGKGFSVVAEEVRVLAAKSADAARETTALIEKSINNIQDGSKTAAVTSEAFGKIVGNIDSVAGIVALISDASNEQATGISQIGSGIEQVSGVIQTNTATAQQSSAASQELSTQANHLKEMVLKFKLRD